MSRDWLNLTWWEKTWSERGQTVFAMTMAFAIVLALFLGALLVLTRIIDVQDQRRSEIRACLKQATTVLDHEDCYR
jgi:F0F1-type ATP synthase membrane subunit b/b'